MDYSSLAKSLPWAKGVRVVVCDANGLLAVEKPSGVMSHPNKRGEERRALLNAPYDMDAEVFRVSIGEGDPIEVTLLNRLDGATSGLVLLSLNRDLRDPVLKAFELKKVRKTYEALVFGMPRRGAPLWKDRLKVTKSEGGVRASAGGGGLGAETKLVGVKPIPGPPLLSLLTLMPLTGRTHQLRIQTSKRGIPIVGDRTYGDFQKNKQIAKARGLKQLCLHCVKVELEYIHRGRKNSFKASSAAVFIQA